MRTGAESGELASSRASSVQSRASSPGPADALAAFAAIGGHGGILVLLRVPNRLRRVWLSKDFGEYAQHEENVP